MNSRSAHAAVLVMLTAGSLVVSTTALAGPAYAGNSISILGQKANNAQKQQKQTEKTARKLAKLLSSDPKTQRKLNVGGSRWTDNIKALGYEQIPEGQFEKRKGAGFNEELVVKNLATKPPGTRVDMIQVLADPEGDSPPEARRTVLTQTRNGFINLKTPGFQNEYVSPHNRLLVVNVFAKTETPRRDHH